VICAIAALLKLAAQANHKIVQSEIAVQTSQHCDLSELTVQPSQQSDLTELDIQPTQQSDLSGTSFEKARKSCNLLAPFSCFCEYSQVSRTYSQHLYVIQCFSSMYKHKLVPERNVLPVTFHINCAN